MIRKTFGILILILIIARSMSYWIFTDLLYPEMPKDVDAMFRFWGDVGYFPYIKALSMGITGEVATYEHYNEGSWPFPYLPFVPFSIALRLFGDEFGFIIADFFSVGLIFLGFYSLFRTFQIEKGTSACITAFILSSAAAYWSAAMMAVSQIELLKYSAIGFAVLTVGFALLFRGFRNSEAATLFMIIGAFTVVIALYLAPGVGTNIWSMRIPRPLFSLIYFIFSLTLIARSYVNRPIGNIKIHYFLLGLGLAASLQTDLAAGASLGVLLLFLMPNILRHSKKNTWQASAFSFLGFLLLSLPWLISMQGSLLEAKVRMGLFSISRYSPVFLEIEKNIIPFLVTCLAYWSVKRLVIVNRGGHESFVAEKERLLYLMLMLIPATWLTVPLISIVAGKMIQVDRFSLHLGNHYFLVHSVFFGIAISNLGKLKTTKAITQKLDLRASNFFLAGFILIALFNGYRAVSKNTHLRYSQFSEYKELGDKYKRDFLELTTYLKSINSSNPRVLATFDVQLFSWWVTFNQGYSFLIDPFGSTRPDKEMEERLFMLGHELGLSPDEFIQKIDTFTMKHFWLGHCKYTADKAHTFSPMDEYSAEDRKLISKAPPGSWSLIISQAEKSRLKNSYRLSSQDSTYRLDMIILTKNSRENDIVPKNRYKLSYENETFRVYLSGNIDTAKKS